MRMYTSCLLLTLFLLAQFNASAQTTNLRLSIHDTKNQPVRGASISIVQVADSSRHWERVTDSAGTVVIDLPTEGFYQLNVTALNFHPYDKNLAVKPGPNMYSIIMQEMVKTMEGVVVRARKPLMRQEDDKTIVDPENLAAISTNAFETIEKTPGLFIDPDGNIYISSSTPATVYINGREQKMPAAEVATMLKSLPPNAIASIEILRTPSARYDASGSGGVVNVVLKKGVRIGLTGSVNGGWQQGRYGSQYAGVSINNNDGKLTTYFNFNTGRRASWEHIQTDRFVTADTVLSQDAETKYQSSNYYTGFGLSYEFSKKWEGSYDARVSFNRNDNNSGNESFFKSVTTGNSSGGRNTEVSNRGRSFYLSQGVNLKYKIDSLGSEWVTDLSFSASPGRNEQSFVYGEGRMKDRPYFYAAQTNLVKKMRNRFTVEGGLKTTGVQFRSNTDYFLFLNGGTVPDAQRSGAYRYRQQIHAAYLQASKTVTGITFKGGVRGENTRMNGLQLFPSDTSFSINRTDFFPYLYISRGLMKIAGYELRAYLVYRRTISRPAYENLNPTIRFIDPFLYETGNPSLRPQFTQNYEANVSVDERPIIAIGRNETKDIFTQVIYPTDTSSKVSYRTYDNLGRNRETYFRAMGAIPPGGTYFFVVVVQYNLNSYKGIYENKPLAFTRGSWTVFSYQTLKLSPLTNLSVSGFMRFKGQQQFYELGSFGELRASINQQFLKKKLTLTLTANDLLRTNRYNFTIAQGSIRASGLRESDSRRFGINLRYQFGLRKKNDEGNMFNVDAGG